MLRDERQVQSLTIGINSQATMQATRHRRDILGQYLVEAFHKQMAMWEKHPGIKITLRWMPDHTGIPGNE